ncbi:MAG TPA: ABC transporter substrate-binding protein [Candidatus Acidoferrales bacterium]|nr:ABC transporter substrate-binding protein [Candidatus Acidoferrales bacterium]
MKLRSFLLLAAISIALVHPGRVETARRPRYGGTLRVEIGAVVNSLDPVVAAANPEESAAKDQIGALLYDHRNPDGTFAGVAGSGAFRIAAWEPGKHVTLAASENNRGARAFVDSVEIQMGRQARDRLLDLEVGNTDFAQIPAEQARSASEHGVRVSASDPDELVAVVFVAGRPIAEDAHAREALARSIDRAAMVNFILQKEGQPAGGLLPQWSSGTAFLFSTAADAAGAKQLWSQISGSPAIVLGYDSGDSLEQTVAERIAVNARDAGISITAESVTSPGSAAPNCDARLMRVRMPSPHPREALVNVVAMLGPTAALDVAPLPAGVSSDQVFARERAIVGSYRVIPLVWLPQVYGLSARVRDWNAPAPGESWPFADVWLEQESQ